MSPVITIMALTLCAGLIALMRAVLVAPVGSEDENGFVFKAAAKKTVKPAATGRLLAPAPVRAHHRVGVSGGGLGAADDHRRAPRSEAISANRAAARRHSVPLEDQNQLNFSGT
jgi:hypothetical protein